MVQVDATVVSKGASIDELESFTGNGMAHFFASLPPSAATKPAGLRLSRKRSHGQLPSDPGSDATALSKHGFGES
jgi:hypothetical protein